MIYARLFKKAFALAKEREWEFIAVAVDLHSTVFKPTYSTELATEYYPHAREVLSILSKDPRVKMYMYTCTPSQLRKEYRKVMNKDGIDILTHPESVMNAMSIKENDFQAFDTKPYFNVLLEDKAGFNPELDWLDILIYLKTGI